ncbi:MAG: helix-turn-helix transcriptional regulator [Clostridia bacterium]|nr:helix-turn-helix transcriptional regulator [Clostridia bacterium]
MKELKEIIATNISELRSEAGITQIKLASALNYSDKAVSKWERAESIPDIVVLKQIADYFHVTVDYLLCEEHREHKEKRKHMLRQMRRNNFIITCLSILLVWFIATFIFVELNITLTTPAIPSWMVFIYAIPVSLTVLLVLNSVWGNKRLNYLIISLMVWTVLLTVYLTLLFAIEQSLWLIFILGIPAQLIIFLWSGLKRLRTEV